MSTVGDIDYTKLTWTQSVTGHMADTVNLWTTVNKDDSFFGKKIVKKIGGEAGYLFLAVGSVVETAIRGIIVQPVAIVGSYFTNRCDSKATAQQLKINVVILAKVFVAVVTHITSNADLQESAKGVHDKFFPKQVTAQAAVKTTNDGPSPVKATVVVQQPSSSSEYQ
jgi:hypothetical protein